jgi:hypothetical protein
VDPDPDPDPGGQKLLTKIEKSSVQNIYVFKCWMFPFEVEGFS